jgi:hypothetical protein
VAAQLLRARHPRHDKDLNAIRQYILDNPANWSQDTENPDRSV